MDPYTFFAVGAGRLSGVGIHAWSQEAVFWG